MRVSLFTTTLCPKIATVFDPRTMCRSTVALVAIFGLLVALAPSADARVGALCVEQGSQIVRRHC